MVASSRCVELQLRMPAVRIQFVFLQQTASGRRKIAEAEQEQRTETSSSVRGTDDKYCIVEQIMF